MKLPQQSANVRWEFVEIGYGAAASPTTKRGIKPSIGGGGQPPPPPYYCNGYKCWCYGTYNCQIMFESGACANGSSCEGNYCECQEKAWS